MRAFYFLATLAVIVLTGYVATFLVEHRLDSPRPLRPPALVLLNGVQRDDGLAIKPPTERVYCPGDTLMWVAHAQVIRDADLTAGRWLKQQTDSGSRIVASLDAAVASESSSSIFGLEEGDEIKVRRTYQIGQLEPGEYYVLNSLSEQNSAPLRYKVWFNVGTCGREVSPDPKL